MISSALGLLSSAGSWMGSNLSSAGSWIGKNLGGIGSALGGVGGLVSSFLGTSSAVKKQKKLAQYQADLNWQYQKKAWQEGYTYQREGLENAGYNPMLALGGASASSFSAGSMPSASVPDYAGSAESGAKLGKVLSSLANLEVEEKEATIKNIESNTLKNNVGTLVGGVAQAAGVFSQVATAMAATNAAKALKKKFGGVDLTKYLNLDKLQNPSNALNSNSASSFFSKISPYLVPALTGSAAAALGGGVGYLLYGDEKKRERTGKYYENMYKHKPWSFSPLR